MALDTYLVNIDKVETEGAKVVQFFFHNEPALVFGDSKTAPPTGRAMDVIRKELQTRGIGYGWEEMNGVWRPKTDGGDDYQIVGAGQAIIQPDLKEVICYGLSLDYADLAKETGDVLMDVAHLKFIDDHVDWSIEYAGSRKPESLR